MINNNSTNYKLDKNIKLYKNQFDKLSSELFNGYEIDRVSLDTDSLLFKIKYMINHNHINSDKFNETKNKFIDSASNLQNMFTDFVYTLLCDIIKLPEDYNTKELIIDLLVTDVKVDQLYVTFSIHIISESKMYLESLNDNLPDDEVFNIFPNEFFRFQTDSYNDAIAKAYPELFENRIQDKIGTGSDEEVFVHNFTFQTSESCNLSCLPAGTEILMYHENPLLIEYKNIEDIKIGDIIYGFDETPVNGERNFMPSKVTRLFKNESSCYRILIDGHKDLYITEDHPILTANGKWIHVKELTKNDGICEILYNYITGKFNINYLYDYEIYSHATEKIPVYNIETECHTYIANDILVHNCTYCYQINKTPMKMDFETAKKFIDELLDDRYGYINRYNSPAIIIEFIGGEPLLEIKLTRKIYEYFLDRCYELDHPWFALHRVSICSNGLLYFDDEVQSFFKDYHQNISFNISIDGNKELHDTCRIQPNGEGSYDIDMIALNHYNKHYTSERNSKMTLAPSNIKYLFDSVVDFINNGMMSINLNCIFEEGWNQDTAKEEYYQLKKLADYILENDLEYIYIAIFNERPEDMQEKYSDGSFCGGGSGSMLAMRPNGDFYPCIRYMPTSVGTDVPDTNIGNVYTGLIERSNDSKVLYELDRNTRRAQSNDICYDCPISNDCPSCAALGYQTFGVFNKKTTFICIQMIAEALANVYYWNLLNIKHPEYELGVRKNVLPDEWSLLVIDKEELDLLKMIESSSMISTIDYHK